MNTEIGFWKLNAPQKDTHPSWVYMDDAFTDAECDQIISLGRSLDMVPGTVYNTKDEDPSVVPSTRNSMVSWINPNDDTFWVYKRLSTIANILNNDYYGFDLDGFSEGMQFTEYNSPSGMHGLHMDKSPNAMVRKITIIVQLTDANSYEGCDLEVLDSEGRTKLLRKRGTLLMFPSWTFHEVTPITSGTRNSLVAWITGASFR